MIKRELASKLAPIATKMLIVSLTGPRQSGKSALEQDVFDWLTNAVGFRDLDFMFAEEEKKPAE
jgi:uridine kinase